MALNKDFYKAVEDIIGPENISDDPVVTESYSFPIRAATAPPATAARNRPPTFGDGHLVCHIAPLPERLIVLEQRRIAFQCSGDFR